MTSCKLARSSTLYFPDSYILNNRIIVASFVCKGSHIGQAIITYGLSYVYQRVRVVASQCFLTIFKIIDEIHFYCSNSFPNEWFGTKVSLDC